MTDMTYRHVGRSGLRVSSVSLGGWVTFGGTIDIDASLAVMRQAATLGINFLDLADIYAKGAAEQVAGRFLAEQTRSDFVVSSKVFWPMSDNTNNRGLSRKHIMESCEASLRRLGTDYLDLYFCHRSDPETPLDETLRAMEDLVRQGKVLYWGTSVWDADLLQEACALTKARGWDAPIVEQPHYNLLDRSIEKDVLPTAHENGMGLVVWSPLAQGLLTGKYNDGVPAGSRAATTNWLERELTDDNLERVRAFCALAREAGLEPGTLALAWCLRRPEVSSVITGASRPEQVQRNVQAVSVTLDDDLVGALNTLFPVDLAS